jgi:hypothetical protein
MKISIKRFILLASIFVVAVSTQAGTLDDLEAEATKPSKRSSSSSNNNSSSNSRESSGNALTDQLAAGFAEMIVEVTFKLAEVGLTVLAEGGESSVHRYANKTHTSTDSLYRQKGDAILPTVKIASQFLTASDGITAQLNRVEAGFALLGFSYSENKLKESGDALTLSNTLLHYRMSFGNDISWDLAYGRGRMNGNQVHTGDVFAMPIRLRLNPAWHFEYYPVWSSYNGGSLSEHQFSVNYQYQHYGITAGYKRWSAGVASVDGVFGGLYLSF